MTVSCPGARERFAAYLDEALLFEERSAVRSHLAECAACRREAAALDPALLFAAVPPEDVSPEEKARVLEAVRAGIALKAAERRVGKKSSRRRIVAAAAGAAAAVAITFSFSAPSPRRPLPPTAQAFRGIKASEPADAAIKAFSDIVFDAGYSAPVRTPRGRDISAACGQLKSDSVRARRTERATLVAS